MNDTAKKLEQTINDIIIQAGNKNEVLVGDCHCNHDFTNTQKHILMLISKENISNKELASSLNISQAAVTKAIKSLIDNNMILAQKDPNDARVLKYTLSEDALFVAQEHENHHKRTIDYYKQVLSKYDESQLKVIDSFLNDLNTIIRS